MTQAAERQVSNKDDYELADETTDPTQSVVGGEFTIPLQVDDDRAMKAGMVKRERHK